MSLNIKTFHELLELIRGLDEQEAKLMILTLKHKKPSTYKHFANYRSAGETTQLTII